MTVKRIIWKITKWLLVTVGVLIGSLLLLIGGLYVYYEWIWQEWSPARIERITGIRVPSYKIIESNEGTRSFTGDYVDSYEIEFNTMPSDEMFDEIDKKIATGKTGVRREGDEYSFSVTWGNGFPAPKGENENDDRIFRIAITRGEKVGEIRSGAW